MKNALDSNLFWCKALPVMILNFGIDRSGQTVKTSVVGEH